MTKGSHTIIRLAVLTVALATCRGLSRAQGPLYVVGGEPMRSIGHIAQSDIESIESLPADEETIARYGEDAGNGVIIVTLRYDTPARFTAEGYSGFNDYISSNVDWDDRMPAAKISLRYTVLSDGSVTVEEILQSTDKRLLRRVTRAMAEAPAWQPAMRDGTPVESRHLLNIILPAGKQLPAERGIILL